MRIWPNTELPPPSHLFSLNHLVKASRADASLGGGAPPTTLLLEESLELERHWMPSPPPLKATQAALSSSAFPQSFPPR
jgi:hypothetical protein